MRIFFFEDFSVWQASQSRLQRKNYDANGVFLQPDEEVKKKI